MTLTEFLLARLFEDEMVAGSIDADPSNVFGNYGGTWMRWLVVAGDRPWQKGRARVLADVDAKRQIVENHERNRTDLMRECNAYSWEMRVLTEPYAGHPDYREEWKP